MNKQSAKTLKQRAHHLKPVVILGAQGLTENVNQEIDVALTAHQLIKIKINAEDREQVKQLAQQISKAHQAELIDIIGHIAVLHRKKD